MGFLLIRFATVTFSSILMKLLKLKIDQINDIIYSLHSVTRFMPNQSIFVIVKNNKKKKLHIP